MLLVLFLDVRYLTLMRVSNTEKFREQTPEDIPDGEPTESASNRDGVLPDDYLAWLTEQLRLAALLGEGDEPPDSHA